jgi:hypothetical protein
MFSKQVIKERCPHTANMQMTGRGGRKTNSYGIIFHFFLGLSENSSFAGTLLWRICETKICLISVICVLFLGYGRAMVPI